MHLQKHDDGLLTPVTEPGSGALCANELLNIDVFADGGALNCFTLGLVNSHETQVLKTKFAITQMKTRTFQP